MNLYDVSAESSFSLNFVFVSAANHQLYLDGTYLFNLLGVENYHRNNNVWAYGLVSRWEYK